MLETGAYDRQWAEVHMQPEQTLQAHLDLRGRWLLPVHNGTFDLAMHAWNEPFERIQALAQARDVKLATPVMGRTGGAGSAAHGASVVAGPRDLKGHTSSALGYR